ncbi:hypothetical protein [Isoptericola sp. NPDC057559]|uniref:hypothetical protein n=1 Tax=Isoptericola sp. NPDC057559 TaxID=3346168 RepID=UPI0036BD4BFA
MFGVLVGDVAVEPMALLLVLTLAAAGLLWWDGRHAVAPTTSARRAVTHATITVGVAVFPLAVGLASPVLVYYFGLLVRLEPHLLAALPIVGLWAFLAVHGVGELTWPGPRGTHREARLVARTTSDVAGRASRGLLWATVAALAVTTAALGLAADGPRTIARLDGSTVAAEGSFPGWSWTLPLLAAAVVAGAGSEVVLRLVASRPAVEGVDEAWDMWLRRRVARRVLRVALLVLGLSLAGIVGLAGLSLRWLDLHVTLGTVLFWIGIAIAAGALLVTVWPTRDPAPRPAIGQTHPVVHS